MFFSEKRLLKGKNVMKQGKNSYFFKRGYLCLKSGQK